MGRQGMLQHIRLTITDPTMSTCQLRQLRRTSKSQSLRTIMNIKHLCRLPENFWFASGTTDCHSSYPSDGPHILVTLLHRDRSPASRIIEK